jgi:hypothetical protein
MEVHKQAQEYNKKYYSVSDLIDISKEIKPETVDIRTICGYHHIVGVEYDIQDFVDTVKRVQEADLSYPILLYRGFVMDGKHRLAKALLEGKKTIKVKYLTELPVPIS